MSRIAFCLQTWGNSVGKGDVASAVDLCRLIADIESDRRSDIFWMVVYGRGTPQDYVASCIQNLRAKFPAESYQARNFGVGSGHPQGSNALWDSSMAWIEGLARDQKKFPYTGVQLLEVDTCPMRIDWIDVLRKEWDEKVIASGLWTEEEADPELRRVAEWPKFECMGHADHEHINGNMIVRPDILKRHPYLRQYTTNWGWDHMNGAHYLKIGCDTNFILQNYRMPDITRGQLPFIKKNMERPAFLHGCQGKVGVKLRKFMRDILVEGVPLEEYAKA